MSLKFPQLQPFYIYNTGATIGDTSLLFSTMNKIDGTNVAMTDFGDKGFITIRPNEGSAEMQISFTELTQNGDGTTTLTGVKDVLMVSPYTESSGISNSIPGNAKAVVSVSSGLLNTFANKQNDETFVGDVTFSTQSPTVPTELSSEVNRAASIEFVNAIAVAGAPDAAENVKGIGEIPTTTEINDGTENGSVGPLLVNPKNLALSIYKTQLPSADEKAAIAGNSGTAVSATNKLIDADDVAVTGTADKVVRANGSGKIDEGYQQMTDAQATGLVGAVPTYIHTHGHSDPIFDKATFNVSGLVLSCGKDWLMDGNGIDVDNANYLEVSSDGSSDDEAQLYGNLVEKGDTATPVGTLSLANGFGLETRCVLSDIAGTKYISAFIGLPPLAVTSMDFGNITAVNDSNYIAKHIGFIWNRPNGGSWALYASCGNGSSQNLSSAISGYTDPTVSHDYRIIYNLTDIKFYIDGVLKATLDSGLPTAGTTSGAYPGVFVWDDYGSSDRYGDVTVYKHFTRAAISFA